MSLAAVSPSHTAIQNLRRGWWLFAFSSLLMLVSGFSLLALTWRIDFAARWLFLPALTAMYLLVVLRRNLAFNHRHNEQVLLPSFGWGNRLTLLRGLFVAALTGFLLVPAPPGGLVWLPGILYVLSNAADFFDGYLARVTNHATRLGEVLDMSFDGLGVGAATFLAVQYGQVPNWYLAVALARPLFLLGLWLRRWLGMPIYDLQPAITRRVFAGLQMGFLAVILLPIFSPPGTYIAAALFSLPLLVGFVKDWLAVSGTLRLPTDAATVSFPTRWLSPGLRLAVLALNLASLPRWLELAGEAGAFALFLTLANLALVAAVVAGILPRITAIFALCMLGFYQLYAPLSPDQIILAVTYTGLIYLGGGAYALWTPEEHLFRTHLGERSTQMQEQST